MSRAANILSPRNLEAGAKAGWVLVAGIGVLLLWRLFKKRQPGAVEEIIPILPPAPPATATTPPSPVQAAEPPGISVGALVTTLRARILEPAQGGRVYRRQFGSTFPAVVELVNDAADAQSAQVEIVGDYYELTGGERPGIRTLLPIQRIPGQSVRRLEVAIDTGNASTLLFEFGQANAVFQVKTNGKVTQSTSFEVW